MRLNLKNEITRQVFSKLVQKILKNLKKNVYLVEFFGIFSFVDQMIKRGAVETALGLITRASDHIRSTFTLASLSIARIIVRAALRARARLTTVRIVLAQTEISRQALIARTTGHELFTLTQAG